MGQLGHYLIWILDTQHIDGKSDKGRSKKKLFFSTLSTTQHTYKHIDGKSDNKGRSKKIIFFSTLSTTQQTDIQTNISTEKVKIRVDQQKKKKIFFFNFIDYPIDR